jgi:hypothetical protein
VVQPTSFDLWQQLETALQFPADADFAALYGLLERLFTQQLANQPLSVQLQIAGTLLVQLAEIYAARANRLITDWESQHRPTEPLVELESCLDLFVQSLSLNLSELFEDPDPVQYPAQRQPRSGSQVEAIDKATLLTADWLDTEPASALDPAELATQIHHLAHDENVEQWAAALATAVSVQPARLVELQQRLHLPLIELWLGSLLGGYGLEQRGEFYQTATIWIQQNARAHQVRETEPVLGEKDL